MFVTYQEDTALKSSGVKLGIVDSMEGFLMTSGTPPGSEETVMSSAEAILLPAPCSGLGLNNLDDVSEPETTFEDSAPNQTFLGLVLSDI